VTKFPGLIVLLLVASGLWAQDYGPLLWLDTPAAAAYQQERDGLEALLRSARDRGVPGELLLDKLREGAAKRAPTHQVLTVLGAETERVLALSLVLERSSAPVRGERVPLLKIGSLLLQGGVEMDTMDAVLTYAGSVGKTADRALGACGAALRVVAVSQADPASLRAVSECLIRSTLADQAYANLVSVALKAKKAGLLREEFVTLLIGTLDSGGGLPALDRAIDRRGRRG